MILSANLDQNYAYQLFNGTKQNPAKDILVRLAFAFSLSVKETQLLLYLGNAQKLYIKNRRDSVLLYGLENHLSLAEVNELLENVEEPFLA